MPPDPNMQPVAGCFRMAGTSLAFLRGLASVFKSRRRDARLEGSHCFSDFDRPHQIWRWASPPYCSPDGILLRPSAVEALNRSSPAPPSPTLIRSFQSAACRTDYFPALTEAIFTLFPSLLMVPVTVTALPANLFSSSAILGSFWFSMSRILSLLSTST